MEDTTQKLKNFISRSKSKFAPLLDNIKEAKRLLSGKQWEKNDDNYIATTRNRITINVINNQVQSTANSYAAFPYIWFTGDQETDKEIDNFFKKDSNLFASQEAVLDTCSFGLGVMAIGSEPDAEGKNTPVIYSVNDIERVMLDPDSVELDGSDAMEGALIDYRSRDWVRVHIGGDYLPGERKAMIVSDASCADLIPIITYYVLEADGVHVHTFVNDKEVLDYETAEDGTQNEKTNILPIHRIPIFPVWGERSWTEDGKKIYIGLASKAKEIQRVVNYAFTQLIERLGQSPKAQWRGFLESFKDLDQYYKKAGTGENPIIPANRLANDNKTQLPLPERVNNEVQFGDVFGIVNGSLGLLSSITGVDSKGLADVESDVTATAAAYTAKVFRNNIRHYFDHLRTSFKSMGDTLMVLMGKTGKSVSVTQGPDNLMQLQIARAFIMNLLTQIADPAQKMRFINAALKTFPENEIVSTLYAELNTIPQPSEMEQQAFATIEQMKMALDEKDQKILQMQEQLETYQKSSEDFKAGIIADFIKAKQQHQFRMEEEALKAALAQGADAGKAQAEAAKAGLSLEQQALKLDEEKLKASAEIVKLFGGRV